MTQMTQLIQKFGGNDAKIVWRDRFLLFMVSFIWVMAAILRFGLPALNHYLAETGTLPNETFTADFADFYPVIIALLVFFQGTVIAGTIFGFMLLDEKDDHTITAILVTPVPFKQFLLYRTGMPIVLAFITVLILLFTINQALPSLWQSVLIAAGASLNAPIVALFYAIAAENKVQGFAMAKFVGVAGWTILFGWFVAEPWQWLFGLFPPFFISKAYWMALDGHGLWWIALLLGLILQGGLILWLMRLFNRVVYRS